MEKVIQKAIKGGWDINGLTGQMTYDYEFKVNPFSGRADLLCKDDIGGEFWLDHNKMFNDPLFWQSLCKVGMISDWKCNWHDFIDRLAKGEDPESFFNHFLN